MTFPRIPDCADAGEAQWPWSHRRTFMERLAAQGYSRFTLREYKSIADGFCAAIEKRALSSDDLDGATTERLRQAVLKKIPEYVQTWGKFCLERFIEHLSEAGVAAVPPPPTKKTTARDRLRGQTTSTETIRRCIASTIAARDWLRGAQRAMCVSARRKGGQRMKHQSSSERTEQISAEIAALASLDIKDLKSRWRVLYDTEPPPRISRELLTRVIAYRLQEKVFGGLAPTTRRLLERVTDDRLSHPARLSRTRQTAPGSLLIRQWRGTAHQVTVHADGFVYRGERYGSLSAVARLITGTRWSGPLFFGLRKPAQEVRDGAL